MSNPETTETASDLTVSASAHVVGVLAEALAAKLTEELGWDWEGERFEGVCMRGGSVDVPSGEQVIRELSESLASVVAALPNIVIIDRTVVWYVMRDGQFVAGGRPIAGPFNTQADASAARRALEHSESHGDYWLDSKPTLAAGGQA